MSFPQYDLANYVHTFSRKGEIRSELMFRDQALKAFICVSVVFAVFNYIILRTSINVYKKHHS